MLPRFAVFALLLAAAAVSSGCALCHHVTDHVGNYYGGPVGDWNSEHVRAGSAYSGTSAVLPTDGATGGQRPMPEEIDAPENGRSNTQAGQPWRGFPL
jgi:hypothetical protein